MQKGDDKKQWKHGTQLTKLDMFFMLDFPDIISFVILMVELWILY